MRLIDGEVVARYLTRELAFDAMRRAFRLEADGLAGGSARTGMMHSVGRVRVLAGVVTGLGIYGHKLVAVSEGGVRYLITLFDMTTGETLAMVDGDAIGAYRTAATTALATDILCRANVEVAALIGTGHVAASHLPALQLVRPAEVVRVYSRDPGRRAAFVDRFASEIDAELVAVDSVEEAVEGADLITLATNADQPPIHAGHLRPGMHVNSTGAVRLMLHEVATDAWPVFDTVACDDVGLVFTHAGDARTAVEAGVIDPDDAVPLASLVVDNPPRHRDAVTLFTSAGTAIQDLVLAATILERAAEDNAGTVVPDPISLRPRS